MTRIKSSPGGPPRGHLPPWRPSGIPLTKLVVTWGPSWEHVQKQAVLPLAAICPDRLCCKNSHRSSPSGLHCTEIPPNPFKHLPSFTCGYIQQFIVSSVLVLVISISEQYHILRSGRRNIFNWNHCFKILIN